MRNKVRKAITRLAVAFMLVIAPAVAFVAAPAPAANAYTTGGHTYIQFRNHNATSKCLGVTGGNMNDGNSVVLWDCRSPQQSPDQWWTLQDTVEQPFGGTFITFHTFRNLVNFNKCLGVKGGVMTQGTPLVIWDCNGNPDQEWDWVGAFFGGSQSPPNPIYNLQPYVLNNGEFMGIGVKSAATGNGATVVLWNAQGNPDQQWTEDD